MMVAVQRIGLISDLHGNELALDRVLSDLKAHGVDQIVCLGDVATLGPRPCEVLDRLQALGSVCIRGNHDAFLRDPEFIKEYTEVAEVVEAVDWCRGQISSKHEAFLDTFLDDFVIEMEGGKTLHLYHGSPRSCVEDIVVATPEDALEPMFGDLQATVFVGGHTHIQMVRWFRGMQIVNSGSVGLPFLDFTPGGVPTLLPEAHYAVVESDSGDVQVSLRRVQLDTRALRASAEAVQWPLREYMLSQY